MTMVKWINGGMLAEPYDFSNYVMIGLRSWGNCSFSLEKDEKLLVNLYFF